MSHTVPKWSSNCSYAHVTTYLYNIGTSKDCSTDLLPSQELQARCIGLQSPRKPIAMHTDIIDEIFGHNLGFYYGISPLCTSESIGYLQFLWFRLECPCTASVVRAWDFVHGCTKYIMKFLF